MFKQVTIERLRAIKYLKIEDFRQVNLLVGKNNCGKTTLLEALFLLIGASNPELPLRINTYRGLNIVNESSWRVIFNNLDVDSHIRISGQLENPREKRKLTIKPNRKSALSFESNKTTEMIDIRDSYSGLSPTIDGLILEYSFTKNKGKSKKIKTKIVSTDSGIEFKMEKSYKEPLMGVFLNPKTISSIDERFSSIQIKKRTERVVKVLRHIEPSLYDLSLGSNKIIYCDIGLDRLVPVNVLGDGIFRLLSIVLAISDTQNGIVLIDEIENGFYYTSQEILWNAIFESAKEFNVQVFATTHSMECVKAFSASYSRFDQNDTMRLYRIERKEDDFKAVAYDHQTLEASLESEWEVR